MIGAFESNRDIRLFLDNDEVEKLGSKTIEGVLIRTHRPEEQAKVFVSINDEKCRELMGPGIGVDDKWPWSEKTGVMKVYLQKAYHDELVVRGVTGTRYDMLGSKIELDNMDRVDEIPYATMLPCFVRQVRMDIEKYGDKKDESPDTKE